jgi:hypothetical protein
MSSPRRWAYVAIAAFFILMTGCGSAATHLAVKHSSMCSPGTQLGEAHQLLAPQPGTFYSVDALNPDVVFFHGLYLMYFSGNDRHTAQGNWQTGLAVSRSPTGPFRVQKTLVGNYLNGGTAVWHDRLWHVVEDNPADTPDIQSELASSSDGIHWRHESYLPEFSTPDATYHGADFFLESEGQRLGVYMLAVPPSGGIERSLGFASYASGRWSHFHIILGIKAAASLPWASADLGEPASYYIKGSHYLFFVGLGQDKLTRSIGLARESLANWSVCRDTPAIPNGTRWGPASSIDPSPLIVANRLYLYYGATKSSGLAANLGGSIGVRVFAH